MMAINRAPSGICSPAALPFDRLPSYQAEQ